MIQCAIINTDTNIVINIVDYATVPQGVPPGFPDHCIAVANNGASPGWQYNNSSFVNPNPPLAVPPSAVLSFLQFMALFTAAEQQAIIASNDTRTKLLVIRAAGAGGIMLNNSEVIFGVNYIAVSPPNGPGLILPNRVAQILSGSPPLLLSAFGVVRAYGSLGCSLSSNFSSCTITSVRR